MNMYNIWCSEHLPYIRRSFDEDLRTMTPENQRYFGDWVSFDGYGDVGYYLGTDLVRYLLKEESFDDVINYDLDKIRAGYDRYLERNII